jgi:ligand-binding SRPBCC domain-containing protein
VPRNATNNVAIIKIHTLIKASRARCFDAARDIDLHMQSVSQTDEKAVAGRTSGLIGPGETVTWRARHFGIMQHFTSKISEFDPPSYFQDHMVKGAFKSFIHDHHFIDSNDQTLMIDTLEFHSPLGLLGRVVDALILKSYLKCLLKQRSCTIKTAAESS